MGNETFYWDGLIKICDERACDAKTQTPYESATDHPVSMATTGSGICLQRQ